MGHHHHVSQDAGDKRVLLAVIVNLGLTVAQVVGGVLAGSLALIADALHNFSDAVALIIAFGARKIARRSADASMTFGYGRVEIVAALVNYTTLIVIGLYLVYEAIIRQLNWPLGSALSLLLLAVLGVLVLIYNRYLGMAQLAKGLG